ncbi:uncharacterized protein LOC142547843 [Primulina tabacum]|uniref:uncharacterized protein LOC142547843 n=1 Tax=Primulina tabacum TaxID=48773 RepID=UPI003F5A8A00
MVEVEKTPKELGKKYWNMLKIMLYMMREGVCRKSKVMLDFHMLLSQGKLASKAINKLILHNHHSYFAALTCRSDDSRMSFISPREYEFSCSNTPVYTSYISKRKNRQNDHRHHQPQEVKVVQKVFEILNDYDDSPEASPAPGAIHGTVAAAYSLTAQLRDADKNHQVDKDAEAFIKKFYKDLKNQKRIAALESPSPYHKWAR